MSLQESDLHPDPVRQLERWLGEAEAAGVAEHNAVTVATADAAGQPSARVMLLRGLDDDGLVLYTNTRSRKGRELGANPRVALVLFWPDLQRQVRVEGVAEPVEAAVADAYFRSRARGSQLGAWASDQSEVIPDRRHLERRLAEAEERFSGADVPRPPHWSGYRVRPACFEFWHGRPGRLHDRLLYRREGEGWRVVRLAP